MSQKILFIHIAKAAGSSINRFCADNYDVDKRIMHIESQRDILENKASLNDKDFISGHITYREFKIRLDIEKYFVITCLREPVSHLISHMAWARQLAEPGERRRFETHPSHIQKLALKLSEVDFNSHIAVRALVENFEPEERRTFDNVQVNYLHECYGNQSEEIKLQSALEVVDRLDLVGVMEHVDLFFRRLAAQLGVRLENNPPHENIQATKYGMNPDNLEFVAAIEPLIKYDRILYENAKNNVLNSGGNGKFENGRFA